MSSTPTSYRATARREGRLWVVGVLDVGVTQGYDLAEAHNMAADLVVAVRQVPAQDVDVDLHVDLSPDPQCDLADARKRQDVAERER